MANTIKHSYFFDHPAETVWQYLTDKTLIAQWLMPNDFEPTIGHEFRFTTKPYPDMDFDGIVYCKVLELIPLKKLVYSWKSGSGSGKLILDTKVHWTLMAKDNGTQLDLLHDGFTNEVNAKLFSALNGGWEKNMQKIAERIKEKIHGTTNA